MEATVDNMPLRVAGCSFNALLKLKLSFSRCLYLHLSTTGSAGSCDLPLGRGTGDFFSFNIAHESSRMFSEPYEDTC